MKMRFKQFLHEDTDQVHGSVAEAAAEYVKHCKQFPDIARPLYRLTDNRAGPLRTRVPRVRLSRSLGGSAEGQDYVFSLPAWAGYPPRSTSIFCSTRQEFDGVKIAMLDDGDLNMMNILKGSKSKAFLSMQDLFSFVDQAFAFFRGTKAYQTLPKNSTLQEKLKVIKSVFAPVGKFRDDANGDDEIADKYAEIARDDSYLSKIIMACAIDIPENLTPKAWGAKLVTSADLDLPGKTRECWFSGKYLSVPYQYFDEFKSEVAKLRKEKK